MKLGELLHQASIGVFIAACVCLIGVMLSLGLDIMTAMILSGATLLLLLGWGILLALSLIVEWAGNDGNGMGKD